MSRAWIVTTLAVGLNACITLDGPAPWMQSRHRDHMLTCEEANPVGMTTVVDIMPVKQGYKARLSYWTVGKPEPLAVVNNVHSSEPTENQRVYSGKNFRLEVVYRGLNTSNEDVIDGTLRANLKGVIYDDVMQCRFISDPTDF